MTKKELELKEIFLTEYWKFIEKFEIKHGCKWYGNLTELKIKKK
jgi:hypothetical protein